MKRLGIGMLALALLALLVMAVGAASPAAPFVGAWEAIDVDDSYMRLVISPGPKGAFQFNYKDFGASICGTDDDGPLYPCTIIGELSMEEGLLVGEGPLICLAKPPVEHADSPFEVSYSYDAVSDTLADGWGITWQRMGVLDIHP